MVYSVLEHITYTAEEDPSRMHWKSLYNRLHVKHYFKHPQFYLETISYDLFASRENWLA